MTWVPLVSLVRSRVVPAGTATLLRMMVAQAAFDFVAEAAPLEPEKVQVVARFSTTVGAAATRAALPTTAATMEEKCILTE